MRFPHYPHAQIEYDLADEDGIMAWAEDGHSNSKDIVSPTASQIVTEMVKQNYNHPSIGIAAVKSIQDNLPVNISDIIAINPEASKLSELV